MKKGVRIFITASGNTTVSSNFHILFKISKIAFMKAQKSIFKRPLILETEPYLTLVVKFLCVMSTFSFSLGQF